MLVQFANTWLTNDGSGNVMERAWTSTQELKLDGKEVLQEQPFVRAAAQSIFDRGNMLHTLSFRVTRNFQALLASPQALTLASGFTLQLADGESLAVNPAVATNPVALASLFALTHFAGLPKVGALVMTCGGWGEAPAYAQAAQAGLASASSTTKGVQVVTTYTLRFGAIASFNPATDKPITTPHGAAITTPSGVPLVLP